MTHSVWQQFPTIFITTIFGNVTSFPHFPFISHKIPQNRSDYVLNGGVYQKDRLNCLEAAMGHMKQCEWLFSRFIYDPVSHWLSARPLRCVPIYACRFFSRPHNFVNHFQVVQHLLEKLAKCWQGFFQLPKPIYHARSWSSVTQKNKICTFRSEKDCGKERKTNGYSFLLRILQQVNVHQKLFLN